MIACSLYKISIRTHELGKLREKRFMSTTKIFYKVDLRIETYYNYCWYLIILKG